MVTKFGIVPTVLSACLCACLCACSQPPEEQATQSGGPEKLQSGETASPPPPANRPATNRTALSGPVKQREQTVDAPFGEVTITQFSVENPAHAQAGWLDIAYQDAAGAKTFERAVVMGSWGQMGEWQADGRFSQYPVIVAQGGGAWQGLSCTWTSLTELRPSGPVELVRYLSDYSNAGADAGSGRELEDMSSQIIEAGPQGFTARFTGTHTFTAQYTREGGAFILSSGEDTQLHGC